MKFIKIRPSAIDKQIPVFEFMFGVNEIKMFIGLLDNALCHLPETFENRPQRRRMKNMVKALKNTLDDYNQGKIKL